MAKRGARLPENTPVYEIRVQNGVRKGMRFEIYQLPSAASPGMTGQLYIGGLEGAPLRLNEHRILKKLAKLKISVSRSVDEKRWRIDEENALQLGLLFRALAPMKNLDRIQMVAGGIESMSREEAAYWLGMVMYRKKPARVLAAMRMLLTTP